MKTNENNVNLPEARSAIAWRNSADIASIKSHHNVIFREVDMTIIHSKPDLIAAIAKALNFPDYFAGNWDSFEECLAEFDFVEPPLYLILIFRHAETIFDLGKDSETLFSIFRDVSEEWTTSANERSLSVVLEGEADEKSEVILNSVGLKSL